MQMGDAPDLEMDSLLPAMRVGIRSRWKRAIPGAEMSHGRR